MKLSIIIPVYNVEKYLESCILSVLKQSEINDTEIILVDDCGKDDSINIAKRIVKEYSVNYNIKIVFHTHNQGLSAARNTGVKNATGDYVFFLDSDDELPENTIVTFKEYLSQYGNNVDFFVGNYIVEGPFKGSILNNTRVLYSGQEEIFNAYINNEWYVMACGKFINRLFFLKNALWFPIGRLHEDEYFSFKLAYAANNVVVVQENVYIYKIRENSITTKKKRKNYIDTFWTYEQIIDLVKDKGNDLYNQFLITILFRHGLYVSISNLPKKEKFVLLKWIRSKSNHIIIKDNTIKSIVRKLFIHLPSIFAIPLFKFLNYIFKWN